MRYERLIQCADCSSDTKTVRSNTKYCGICRLYRDLLFLGTRTYKCFACDTPFAPLSVNGHLCPNCDVFNHALDSAGVCAFCATESEKLIRSDVSVCRDCAGDPANRKTLVAALRQKQDARKAQPARLEAPAPRAVQLAGDDMPEV